MRRVLFAALVAASSLLGISAAIADKPRALPVQPLAITVSATPINSFDPAEPERVRFGKLEFRGGLELRADTSLFGGWSALRLDVIGSRVIAVSDAGLWLTGRLDYDKGRLTGLSDVTVAAMRGTAGEPLPRIGRGDVESLAIEGNTCFVGIERIHEIRRYDCSGAPFASRGIPLPVPPALKKVPRNEGLETLVAVPRGLPHGGSLIAITEAGERAGEDALGFVLTGGRAIPFRVKLSDGFSITDGAIVGSSLVLLERHFSMLRGVAIRLRRVPLAAIQPGAVVDGEVLMVAGRAHQIDNMEGLAAHANAAGETILTLISDDNFSFLQRSLILQFALVE